MIKAIIGIGFGDESKGQVVNNLCRYVPVNNSIVVRFNGGQQCGHTVIDNGKKHVFSNFGSGTFHNIPTYWSKFCTVDPVGIYNEYGVLLDKQIEPVLFIDSKCPVTTPYDKMDNQRSKSYNKNGTVGVGFGKTICREESFHSLLFEDLFYPSVFFEKLRLIKEYYNHIENLDMREFYLACAFVKANCYKLDGTPIKRNYILEGAQGLLLDQHYGFFPNVTRSNTGSENIQKLFPKKDIEFYLVTRAYQTRHGNGFMTNENIPHNIKLSKNETNIKHQYQGEFRYSLLDIDLLQYALNKDQFIKKSKKKFVITCLNAIKNEYRFTYQGKIICCDDRKNFIKKVISYLK